MSKNKKEKIITLNLVSELFKDKKGKIIDKDTFARNDALALMQILAYYNSVKGTFREFETVLALQDKTKNAWLKDSKTLDLSITEAAFLKDYLENFNEKSIPIQTPTGVNPNNLSEFRLRTLINVVKQLS